MMMQLLVMYDLKVTYNDFFLLDAFDINVILSF